MPGDTRFTRFFAAYSVNAAGSALSAGALPLIAVVVLDAGPWQVSLLAAAGLAAGALAAVPLGGYVDRTARRTAMIAANTIGFACLATVPAAAAIGGLTFAHLCVVAAVQAIVTIGYTAAAGAYVKDLVPQRDLAKASARLDTAGWLTQSAGPPAGGLLIGAIGPTVTVLADAVSYLASALMLRGAPAIPAHSPSGVGTDLLGGWKWISGHQALRRLYLNAMIFGGAVMWSSPLIAVLLLKEMGATAWQYGLVLGVPCLGGVVGAVLSPRLSARYGQQRVFLLSGLARTPWLLAMPFLHNPYSVMVVDVFLLLAAGVFNPLFAAYRASVTPAELMGRVIAAWALGSKTVQPLFIIVGGLAATALSVRTSLLLAGVMCVASVVALPKVA